MPDAIFAHLRLAPIYDAFDRERGALAAYLGLAEELRPGGFLVFETRRPERRAWEEWAADTGPVVLDSFRYTYTFLADGAVITSDSTLRFRSRDEVEASLAAHGYRLLDVRQAPDRPGREFVFISEKQT